MKKLLIFGSIGILILILISIYIIQLPLIIFLLISLIFISLSFKNKKKTFILILSSILLIYFISSLIFSWPFLFTFNYLPDEANNKTCMVDSDCVITYLPFGNNHCCIGCEIMSINKEAKDIKDGWVSENCKNSQDRCIRFYCSMPLFDKPICINNTCQILECVSGDDWRNKISDYRINLNNPNLECCEGLIEYQINKNESICTKCVEENEFYSYFGLPYEQRIEQTKTQDKCCEGLVRIDQYKDGKPIVLDALLDTGISEFITFSYCTNCGDGICNYPEDEYNCPEDCN